MRLMDGHPQPLEGGDGHPHFIGKWSHVCAVSCMYVCMYTHIVRYIHIV